MSDYLGLGIRTVVNAGGAQSRLGGATMSREVREAMSRASTEYVDIEALHDLVGERIAAATGTAAACVSAGSAAGIMIAVAATIVGTDRMRAAELPRATEPRPTVAVWAAHTIGPLAGADSEHANGYLNSIAAGGAAVRVMTEHTGVLASDVAVLWFPGMYGIPREDELLVQVVAAAHDLGVPVIVDAADQVPPVSALAKYTRELGADLSIYSGGKGLRGPTSSGLVLGRRDLVAACRANSGTEHGVGRPAKVGREELVGLMTAVELACARDEDAEYRAQEATVAGWHDRLRALEPHVELSTTPTGHCGQHVPRLVVRLQSERRECRDILIEDLWDSDPRIAVLPEPQGALALSPQLLVDDQPAYVVTRVLDLVGAHVTSCAECSP